MNSQMLVQNREQGVAVPEPVLQPVLARQDQRRRRGQQRGDQHRLRAAPGAPNAEPDRADRHERARKDRGAPGRVLRAQDGGDEDAEQHGIIPPPGLPQPDRRERQRNREERREVIRLARQVAVEQKYRRKQEEHHPGPGRAYARHQSANERGDAGQRRQEDDHLHVHAQLEAIEQDAGRQQEPPRVREAGRVRVAVEPPPHRRRAHGPLQRELLGQGQVVPARIPVKDLGREDLEIDEPDPHQPEHHHGELKHRRSQLAKIVPAERQRRPQPASAGRQERERQEHEGDRAQQVQQPQDEDRRLEPEHPQRECQSPERELRLRFDPQPVQREISKRPAAGPQTTASPATHRYPPGQPGAYRVVKVRNRQEQHQSSQKDGGDEIRSFGTAMDGPPDGRPPHASRQPPGRSRPGYNARTRRPG